MPVLEQIISGASASGSGLGVLGAIPTFGSLYAAYLLGTAWHDDAAFDISGNGNEATISGAFGVGDFAMRMGKASYLTLPFSGATLAAAGSGTFSFAYAVLANPTTNCMFLGNYADDGSSDSFYIYNVVNSHCVAKNSIHNGSSGTIEELTWDSASGAQWEFHAGCFGPNVLSIYRTYHGGTPQYSRSTGASTLYGGSRNIRAGYCYTPDNNFYGENEMSMLGLWTGELTEADMGEVYTAFSNLMGQQGILL